MHGIIFAELQRYVRTGLGDEAWAKLLEEAGLPGKIYLVVEQYPDEELVALVAAASRITGQPEQAILEDFGEAIVPGLLQIYGSLVKPSWRTLDLLEHTEETIHTAVRLRNPGATPPRLRTTRHSPEMVQISYDSPRQMCAVATGIIRGVAKHYDEDVTIAQPSCMLKGGPTCEIEVRQAA